MELRKINNKGYPTMAFVLIGLIIAFAIGAFLLMFIRKGLQTDRGITKECGKDVLKCRQSVEIVNKLKSGGKSIFLDMEESCKHRSIDATEKNASEVAEVILHEISKCYFAFGEGNIEIGKSFEQVFSSKTIPCAYINIPQHSIKDVYSQVMDKVNKVKNVCSIDGETVQQQLDKKNKDKLKVTAFKMLEKIKKEKPSCKILKLKIYKPARVIDNFGISDESVTFECAG